MRNTIHLGPLAQSNLRRARWAMLGLMITLVAGACDLTELLPPVVEDPEPTVASLTVSPSELDLDMDSVGTRQIEAKAFDASGQPIEMSPGDFTWTSSDEAVAIVSAIGEVTAVAEGDAAITASLDAHEGTVSVRVLGVQPEPDEPEAPEEEEEEAPEEEEEPEEERPDFGEWDFVLQDTVVRGSNVVVPEGETWLFGPDVEVDRGNVIVQGTLAMRPGSSLKFLGADPDRYVGGGMMWDASRFQNDIGLWVVDTGALDIQGTPKKGWNRTGSHPTWDAGDEYYIAPTDVGDTDVQRWYPGNPVPQVDPRVPAAEVVNVTRDIVIEGPGHIHIHSGRTQRIEYVQLRGLGISNSASKGAVLGRYALHLHHGLDGTRGTIVRGVAAVNSGGKVFVPHMSHGVTMIDNVSVNSMGAGLWWDVGDNTNDLLVDSMAVLGVYMPRDLTGKIPSEDAFVLGSGVNMEVRNSVAVGATGSKGTIGFSWTRGGETPSPVWIFERGNVAHNNQGAGIRFWTNLADEHVVRDYTGYHNGRSMQPFSWAGIESGAYHNDVFQEDILLVGEHILQQANARNGSGYRNLVVEANNSPAMVVGHRHLSANGYLVVENCSLTPGNGHPKVLVTKGTNFTNPWRAHFKNCDITPSDIEFERLKGGNEGTHILIDHEDGRKWEISIQNGRKIVSSR